MADTTPAVTTVNEGDDSSEEEEVLVDHEEEILEEEEVLAEGEEEIIEEDGEEVIDGEEEILEEEGEEVVEDDSDDAEEGDIENQAKDAPESQSRSSPAAAANTGLPDKGENECRNFIICIICLLIVAAAIATPLALQAAEDKELPVQTVQNVAPTPTAPGVPTAAPIGPPGSTSPPTTMAPTGPSSERPTGFGAIQLAQFKKNFLIPEFGEGAFLDPDTELSKAAEHMAYEDPYITSLPDVETLGDRFALTALYFALDGDSWESCGKDEDACDRGSSWLSEGFQCDWAGIECTESGRVSGIDLSSGFTGSSDIVGAIPLAIKLVTELALFNLGSSITSPGFVPNEILNLTNLKVLDLSSLQLTGPLPKKLGELPLLEALYLDGNAFSGTVPASFGDLSGLTALTLQENNLSGEIPSEICSLGLGVLESDCNENISCDCCTNPECNA